MTNFPRARRRTVTATDRRPPAELRAVRVIFEPDPDPQTAHFDASLAEALERGEFELLTMRIEAEVSIADTDQWLESPGYSAIPSNADGAWFDQLIAGEWDTLRGVLKTVGVPTDQLPLEVAPEWIHWTGEMT